MRSDHNDTTTSSALPSSTRLLTTPHTNNNDTDHNGHLNNSPIQQVWTAPTDKRSRRFPSPDLPLIAPRLDVGTPVSRPTKAGRDPLEIDATYHTTSWGSPYQRSKEDSRVEGDTPYLSPEERRAQNLFSHSPAPSDRSVLGLDHLIPIRVFVPGRDSSPSFGLDHLIPSRILTQSSPSEAPDLARRDVSDSTEETSDRHARPRSTRSRTEDWLEQHRSAGRSSEKSKWLSEESAGSDSNTDDFKTPIPFTWFAGRHRRRNSASSPILHRQQGRRVQKRYGTKRMAFLRGHNSREANMTPRQEDFQRFVQAHSKDDLQNTSLFESDFAESPVKQRRQLNAIRNRSRSPDKPLPALPIDLSSQNNVTDSKTRQRTKLSWHGKTCWICLPKNVPEAADGRQPLSAAEVQARLRNLEQAGHHVDGFDLSSEPNPATHPPQSRAVYPDPADDLVERKVKRFRVAVPDPKAWKAYCDWLVEEKLRALGVGLVDDPATASISQHGLGHLRQASVSPNLRFPMPGHSHRPSPSLAFLPTHGHARSGSMLPPMPVPSDPRGHMTRHSVFAMPGAMPHAMPQQQTLRPGIPAFSGGPPFGVNQLQRGPSPAFDRLSPSGLHSRTHSSYGRLSPLGQNPQTMQADYFPPQPHVKHQSTYSNLPLQQPAPIGPSVHSNPSLLRLPEEDENTARDYFDGSGQQSQTREDSVIAQPSPRGHRNNISESLERDIVDTEYSFGQSQKQQNSQGSVYHDILNSKQMYLPQHSSVHKDINIHDDTSFSSFANAQTFIPNPSSSNNNITNGGSTGMLNNKLTDKIKSHASKLSVAAPEFKFTPGGAFQPISSNIQRPGSGHSRMVSSINMVPKAATFQPGTFGGAQLSTADFSFSASHNNASAAASQTTASAPNQIPCAGPSIFGNVDLSAATTKPVKKSKAIAIVQPKPAVEDNEVEAEDEHGRTLQSVDRQKRARVRHASGDDVPLFAVPSDSGRPTEPPIQQSIDRTGNPQAEATDEVRAVSSPSGTSAMQTTAEIILSDDPQASAAVPLDSKHKKNASSLSAIDKMSEHDSFSPIAVSSPKRKAQRSVSSALEHKPDFSPARIFSQNGGARSPSPAELDYNTSPEPEKQQPYPDSSVDIAQPDVELDFDAIDAVMQQLNGSDGSPGFVRKQYISGDGSPSGSMLHYAPVDHARSNAPSPSPKHIQHVRDTLSRSVSPLEESFHEGPTYGPSTTNRVDDQSLPTSTWNSDSAAAIDTHRSEARNRVQDEQLNEIISDVIRDHLQPVEKSLFLIHKALTAPERRSRSRIDRARSVVDSDADDEDEDELVVEKSLHRPSSHGKDKRAEQIKAAVSEAFALHGVNSSSNHIPVAEIHDALENVQTTVARMASTHIDLEDIKAAVEAALHQQSRAIVAASPRRLRAPTLESHKRQLSELEGRLHETLSGALEEANHRRAIEEREADTRRLLRLAEEELALLRETIGDKNQRIHATRKDLEAMENRAKTAEHARGQLEVQFSDVEAESAAFASTLEEYRLSSNKWRQQVDDAHNENETLKATVHDLKSQIADGLNIRDNMRGKLDKLHSDMAAASAQLANQKTWWQSRNEDLQKKHAILQAQFDGEVGARRTFEEETQNLRVQVSQGLATKVALDQALRSDAAQAELVAVLKNDLAAEQALVTRLERDVSEAQGTAGLEMQRLQLSLKAVTEDARSQIGHLEAGWERERSLLQAELERSLAIATEDKERAEAYFGSRLALSEDKSLHLQDRVTHLEERLTIAKSAAQAAVSAAQAAKTSAPATRSLASTTIPEKVSPQALRESILVLQEQLQERESRIERIQHQLDSTDPSLPTKLKERESEVTWLRELLAVRNDDLSDLIRTLDEESYDRAAVHDAAVRIRANLQMEQQEKERLISAGSSLPAQAVAGVLNFASPKAVSLAAAFGNWRKSRDFGAPMSTPRVPPGARYPTRLRSSASTSATPSKVAPSPRLPASSSSSGFFAGLMTPPASNLRRTPSPSDMARRPRELSFVGADDGAAGEGSMTPLLRRGSYDEDAEMSVTTPGADEREEYMQDLYRAESKEGKLERAVEDAIALVEAVEGRTLAEEIGGA